MADIKKGDYWPPLRGRAEDQDGAMPLDEAEEILIFMRHTATGLTLIQGTVTAYAEPDTDGFNWEYAWQTGQTQTTGPYEVELQITWDSGTTPPKVESVPNNKQNNPVVTIWDDVD